MSTFLHDAANGQHDDTSVWDVRSVRALLHAQTWKLDKDPWRSWTRCRGGIEYVLTYLTTCPLSAEYQELLDLILNQPGENVHFYITRWRPVHRATFADYVTKLCTALANHLNNWVLKGPELAHSANPPLVPSHGRSLKSLPVPVTSFIGRQQELFTLHDLFSRPTIRLVTLTGPGGTGKTRLALHVAEQLKAKFADGIVFSSLAATHHPEMVLSAIGEALHIKETPQQSIRAGVHKFLVDRQMLLVLDNFEHVIDAALVVSELLQTAKGLKILVTSRQKLHLSGELEYTVAPLALPEARRAYSVDDLGHIPAIALFIDRAQNVKPTFSLNQKNAPIITEICRKLDGLPLAIELAAAQNKHIAPARILERLTNRFEALINGPRDLPARQQTLRAAIDWSYAMLDEREQILFRRLGVFVGGCTLEAIEAVCSERGLVTNLFDIVISLIDKSLVLETEIDDEQRFTMLETMREYAIEKLQVHGEEQTIREHHARYCLSLAEQAEQQTGGPDQGRWLNILEREHDNLRAAMDWSLKHNQSDLALRLSGALWRFWLIRGYLTEGRHWLKQAIDAGVGSPDEIRVKAIDGSGVLAMFHGDYVGALAYNEEALTLFQRLGNQSGASDIMESLGVLHIYMGNYAQAMQFHQESLAIRRALGELPKISSSLTNLGYIASTQAEYEQAQQYTEESLAISRRSGDMHGVGLALCNLGLITLNHHRDSRRAYDLYQESLAIVREIQDKEAVITCLEGYALVAVEVHDGDRAARLFGATDTLRTTFELARRRGPLHDAFEQTSQRTREQLGEAAWSLRTDEGRAMTLDEAIHDALQLYPE